MKKRTRVAKSATKSAAQRKSARRSTPRADRASVATKASGAGGEKRAAYHHGDLGPALHEAARAILEEEGLSALSLRSVARRAGVSHAAPYRHYASLEALLADVASAGFAELRAYLAHAANAPGQKHERIARIAGAYMRFAAQHGGLLRLMLATQFPNRGEFPGLRSAADAIGDDMGEALGDPALGLAVWAAAHGLAMLTLENIIDLGQREAGFQVVPPRAEILFRSLFTEDS